jgi:hypothetical protein
MTNKRENITRPSARAKLCGVSMLSSTRRLGVAAALTAVVLLAGCASPTVSASSYYPAAAGYDPYWDYGWPYDGGFGLDGFVGGDFHRGFHDHDFHSGSFHDHAFHAGDFHAGGFHGGGGHAGGGHGGRG